MSQLGLVLHESLGTQNESTTILDFLTTEQMDDGDRVSRRRRSLKERLGFIGMGCCGATWQFRSGEQEEPLQQQHQLLDTTPGRDPTRLRSEWVGPGSAGTGMNLAAALAAERQLRAPRETEGTTQWRVSLMRLLEETEEEERETVVVGNDSVCCVCMGRKKGAAFIPCGHTFCRVCSRELWLNRGSCPLCNRSILEILDIF